MIEFINDTIVVSHFIPHERAQLHRYHHLEEMLSRFKKGDSKLLHKDKTLTRYKFDGITYEVRNESS